MAEKLVFRIVSNDNHSLISCFIDKIKPEIMSKKTKGTITIINIDQKNENFDYAHKNALDNSSEKDDVVIVTSGYSKDYFTKMNGSKYEKVMERKNVRYLLVPFTHEQLKDAILSCLD